MPDRANIQLHLGNCMEAMREMPDNAFELAIVDPPYFKKAQSPTKMFGKAQQSSSGAYRSKFKDFEVWNIPSDEYFKELLRVSVNQIIWGCNYYAQHIPHNGRIVWDKKNDSSVFSKCEIASKSMDYGVDIFRYMWNGMLQENMKDKEVRIHPTQKPVALYKWLLNNYAKAGDRILDTHLGSGSIALACWDMCFDLTGLEIDADYFEAANERLKNYKAQLQLF